MFELYIEPDHWQGRIDDINDPDTYRWHQVVKLIDLTEDINVDKGICLIGFASDLGVTLNKGRAGAKNAPREIRKYLSSLPWYREDISLYDAGTIVCYDNLPEAQAELADAVEKVVKAGLFPIILGGGHETAYGSFNGLKNGLNKTPAIINFDAHFDMRPYDNGVSSGTMFAQLADELGSGFKYAVLGIQKSGNTKALFKKADKHGVLYLPHEEIETSDKLTGFVAESSDIYLTVCADVIQAASAPGVSAPAPLGMTPELAGRSLRRIMSTRKVVGFDICEVSPENDYNGITSRLAAQLVFTVVDAYEAAK